MYTIYGKEQCPACVNAKKLLDSKDIAYTYISIVPGQVAQDKQITRDAFMEEYPGVRMVPLIITSGGDQLNFNQLVSSLSE